MQQLEGAIRKYDWGSTSSIPSLLGCAEDGKPWAELWLGAHPSAPSVVGESRTPLDELIAADPAAQLGTAVTDRFGSLPFLFKVLAAAAPLSLQAHPSVPQAEAGYVREDAAGIPIDAPNRSFRDRFHKPELICALTDFHALCGFRDPVATLDVLATIDTAALDPIRDRLAVFSDVDGLGPLLEYLLTLPATDAAALVAPVVAACGVPGSDRHADVRAMAAALGERYPGDAGVVTALLLNLVHLKPGEALFLGAGSLHAYLGGTGVEIMANSDNVLRGGLTTKHIDIPTLLEVVDARPTDPVVQRPALVRGIASYDTPVPEFLLDRLDLDGSATVSGPAILLCTDGAVDAGSFSLERGAAAWLPAGDGIIELRGRGTVYRAGVNL
ncbi:MAG: mannose-6-phosphate isomerase, class I [Actinomycetota bacterium]|nr:mannose-6-phosphate isomerase, class I [Actinomycetota bacterium]